MKALGIITICVFCVFTLILLFLHIKSRRPVRSVAINALIGILAIAAVNLTAQFSGVHIPINVYTVPFSAVFGLPAVCTIIIFETFL